MLIEIHAIQNHSPANLNRDDLGAPKTCWFGGVLRSRISSQCLKRSIRMSKEFEALLGGVRTRRLPTLLAHRAQNPDKTVRDILKLMRTHDLPALTEESMKLATEAGKLLQGCGLMPPAKKAKKKGAKEGATGATQGEVEEVEDDDTGSADQRADAILYVTDTAAADMVRLLQGANATAERFAELIAQQVAAPDMALSGRMLEPKAGSAAWANLNKNVEASLQVAHALSTHVARPEVDYFVAVDDVPGEDAGAGYLDEAMFASACFYKYFAINWPTLVSNLQGFPGSQEHLAAHTVGAFIRAAALANPTGKQNSFAAHNPPDGMLVEISNTPISYANAFAKPVTHDDRDIVSQSIAQLAYYVHDMDTGYGKPDHRFWFSPNLRFPLMVIENKHEITLADHNLKSLDDLVPQVIRTLGYDWEEVQKVALSPEVAS
jgi:CRISPR system Cascade subunit CasC